MIRFFSFFMNRNNVLVLFNSWQKYLQQVYLFFWATESAQSLIILIPWWPSSLVITKTLISLIYWFNQSREYEYRLCHVWYFWKLGSVAWSRRTTFCKKRIKDFAFSWKSVRKEVRNMNLTLASYTNRV